MSEKTEQPTPKKLREAREQGQVAHSKDFTQTALIVALFGYILASAEALFTAFAELIVMPVNLLGMPFEDAVEVLITQLMWDMVGLLLPFLLIVIGLGLFVELLQTGLNLSFKAMLPSAKKLNPITNLKNIFALKNAVEFLKSVAKIGFLSALIFLVLRDAIPTLMTLPGGGLAGVGTAFAQLLKTLIVNVAIAYTVLALADLAWQRHRYTKDLLMSKEEVKQEYKEAEGDPHIKHQRKQLHHELMQDSAVHSARKASVLITNPTHLAIAVYYEPEETPLPRVTGKGEGALAQRMVQAAREAGVPVLQNIPLAHALMNEAALDQYIPSELIEPVAEVLRMVRRMAAEPEDRS